VISSTRRSSRLPTRFTSERCCSRVWSETSIRESSHRSATSRSVGAATGAARSNQVGHPHRGEFSCDPVAADLRLTNCWERACGARDGFASSCPPFHPADARSMR
jgi:hypothetical protein